MTRKVDGLAISHVWAVVHKKSLPKRPEMSIQPLFFLKEKRKEDLPGAAFKPLPGKSRPEPMRRPGSVTI
jgi:hypothetical protein